jgi:hypothetical protein
VIGAVAVEATSTLLEAYMNVTEAQCVLFGLLAVLVAVRPQGIAWSLRRRVVAPA